MRKRLPADSKATIGYIRVSTSEQADHGVSLAAQEERLRAYCKLQNLDLAELVREEGVSAFTPLAARPAGLLNRMKATHSAHVVALKLDRLFRNAEDALKTTREWTESSVSLHLVDMGGQSMNTASAMGRMWLTMLAGFAEFERGLTSERTSAALAHKKAHREAYSPTPYGYHREGDALIPAQAEGQTVREILTRRATGETLRSIAEWLNSSGIPTKRGTIWYASTIKAICENSIHQPQ